MKLKIFSLSFFILLFAFLISDCADASKIYFSTSSEQPHQGDVFLTKALINTDRESINLGEINLNFNPDYLSVVNISTADSIFTLWPKSPIFSNEAGTISFIGGVPSGFLGDGELASIYFMALKNGQTSISFQENSAVFLNDGSGSRADLTQETSAIDIFPAGSEVPKNEWEDQIKEDNAPPENFEIKISKIDGKYFAIFSTTDRGSGIDRYEIKEGNGEWKIGTSPYFLENQSLLNKIFVKAVDKAGSEKIGKILPQRLILAWILESLLVLLILTALCWIIWKRTKKRV